MSFSLLLVIQALISDDESTHVIGIAKELQLMHSSYILDWEPIHRLVLGAHHRALKSPLKFNVLTAG